MTLINKGLNKMEYTTFEIAGFHGIATQDDYKLGEIGTSQLTVYPITLSNSTLKNLLHDIAQHFSTEVKYLELDACGDIGRIDINMYQNGNGDIITANDAEYKEWLKGDKRLYSVTYTGTLRKVLTSVSFLNG